MTFALLHFGGEDFHCVLNEDVSDKEYNKNREELVDKYNIFSLTEVIRTLDKYFGNEYFNLKDLFLEEKIKTNLVDFAMVVIINQAVSLLTALFIIPAISDKLALKKPEGEKSLLGITNKDKLNSTLTKLYIKAFRIIYKRKVIFIIILVLSFGTPVYLLPDKLDGERWINKLYNSTFGNENYKTKIKPLVDKSLGGTLRLFTEKVFSGSYFSNPEESYLFISTSFPRGTTLSQSDVLMTKMENFLRQYKEISLFSSNISPRNSSITVYFKEKYRRSEFPYVLKTDVVNKAVEMGGAYWSVQGFGDAFSNSVYETTGNYAIKVTGYNYDRLLQLATDIRTNLAKYERVKEIFIVSERTWYKPDNTEFIAEPNNELFQAYSDLYLTYSNLQNWSIKQPVFNAVINGTKRENIRLIPDEYLTTDLWRLAHLPIKRDTAFYRFGNSFNIKKQITSQVISREDQQYIMFLQFEFVGAEKTARNYINNTLGDFQDQIPIGYNASLLPDNRFLWNDQDKDQYWLLLLVIVIIFFICSILFESLLQPFAVILIIPVSYIGIFLTFYVFRLNFDQGGFAALLMLSGLTVNAAIYILNDYNNLKKSQSPYKNNLFSLYLRAFNNKIIPILLTVLSTVLGFVPFLMGEKQPFWFALAVGTIGGLVFSLIGLLIYLPIFLGLKDNNIIKNKINNIKPI
jgi:multidrug efflux pump subunit AcrB